MLGLRSRLTDYNKQLSDAVSSIDSVLLDEVIELIQDGISCQNIFIIGNGGNASTSSHIACDLQKGFWGTKADVVEISNVVSLCDNAAIITAWANDDDFENIYSQQLERVASECDILIALSASGNSQNIINAVDQAQNMKVDTIGISGFGGGTLSKRVKYPIIIESEDMQIVEDATMIIGHFIFKELIRRLTP